MAQLYSQVTKITCEKALSGMPQEKYISYKYSELLDFLSTLKRQVET